MNLGPAASIWRIPANDELVKKLWADGLSASQIAAQIPGTSRNSIIGRVRRLKLPYRQTVFSAARKPHTARLAPINLQTYEDEPAPDDLLALRRLKANAARFLAWRRARMPAELTF